MITPNYKLTRLNTKMINGTRAAPKVRCRAKKSIKLVGMTMPERLTGDDSEYIPDNLSEITDDFVSSTMSAHETNSDSNKDEKENEIVMEDAKSNGIENVSKDTKASVSDSKSDSKSGKGSDTDSDEHSGSDSHEGSGSHEDGGSGSGENSDSDSDSDSDSSSAEKSVTNSHTQSVDDSSSPCPLSCESSLNDQCAHERDLIQLQTQIDAQTQTQIQTQNQNPIANPVQTEIEAEMSSTLSPTTDDETKTTIETETEAIIPSQNQNWADSPDVIISALFYENESLQRLFQHAMRTGLSTIPNALTFSDALITPLKVIKFLFDGNSSRPMMSYWTQQSPNANWVNICNISRQPIITNLTDEFQNQSNIEYLDPTLLSAVTGILSLDDPTWEGSQIMYAQIQKHDCRISVRGGGSAFIHYVIDNRIIIKSKIGLITMPSRTPTPMPMRNNHNLSNLRNVPLRNLDSINEDNVFNYDMEMEENIYPSAVNEITQNMRSVSVDLSNV